MVVETDLATQLKMIRAAALKVAVASTSCYPEAYNPQKSPLDGHCGPMAWLLHGLFGGEILKGFVNDEPHYWNRFPNGQEFDLTSCQFGGDGMTPLVSGSPVSVRDDLPPFRFVIFVMRVCEELGFHEKVWDLF